MAMICFSGFLQVQEAVKCRVVDRQEDTNGDSGGSFQNGHAQLMVCFCSINELVFICSFDVLFQYDNYCSSPLRLTLRRMWIWLADQVSSRLRALDCVLACASGLSLGTAV